MNAVITAVSIHASRAGGDHRSFRVQHPRIRVSIHASREGGDLMN